MNTHVESSAVVYVCSDGWVCLHNAVSLSVIYLRHAFKWRVFVCVCVKERPQWPEKVLMSAGGRTDALLREGNFVCVCVTLRSCLNPLSLCNNEEGGGGVNVRLLLGSPRLSRPSHSPLITYSTSSPVFSFFYFFGSNNNKHSPESIFSILKQTKVVEVF